MVSVVFFFCPLKGFQATIHVRRYESCNMNLPYTQSIHGKIEEERRADTPLGLYTDYIFKQREIQPSPRKVRQNTSITGLAYVY